MIQEEIKLPYQIFVSLSQSPLHALSWRLKSEGSQKLPNAWILLLGTMPLTDVREVKSIGEISFELGKQLAETQYGLVSGVSSYDSAIHGQGNMAYKETFGLGKIPGSIKEYLRHYRLEYERVIDPELENSTQIIFLADDIDRLNECMTSYSNAAILIGGKEDDFRLAQACIQHGRPVFPIVDSGGAAKQFYDLLLQNYNEEVKESSVFGSNINLKQIYQHSLDAEALDRPYKSAIAEIISHLNMIYAPDDPRMYSFE